METRTRVLTCLVCFIFMNVYSAFSLCINETVLPETAWTMNNYPNPQVDIYRCGRCKKSWICDPNHILPETEADKLDQTLEHIWNNGKCLCSDCTESSRGYSITIAVIEGMKDPGNTDTEIETTAKNFAEHLREEWNFGSCNDNIVILLSHKDRKIFTNVGTTVENIMNYQCLENIYLSVKSQLTDGQYADALKNMINKYRKTINTSQCTESVSKSSDNSVMIYGICFGVVFLLMLTCPFCCVYRNKIQKRLCCCLDMECNCCEDEYTRKYRATQSARKYTSATSSVSTISTTISSGGVGGASSSRTGSGASGSYYNQGCSSSFDHSSGSTSHDFGGGFSSGGGGGDSSGDGGGGF